MAANPVNSDLSHEVIRLGGSNMTLRQLHKRVTGLMAELEREGRMDRADLPVYVRTRVSPRKTQMTPIKYVCSGMMTFSHPDTGEDVRCMEITGDSENTIIGKW